MKTILAITAAILAATLVNTAVAYTYATRQWGDEACRLFRQGYGLKNGVMTAATNIGSTKVLDSPSGELTDYVLSTCRSAAMRAYDRDS